MSKNSKPTSKQHYDVIRPKTTSARPKPKAAEAEPEQIKVTEKWHRKMTASIAFGRLYVTLAISILAATTALWSVLGARLHETNADQLVDPYLFQNNAVFHDAAFPGAHTMLLKWPIFWLISLFHYSTNSYLTASVVIATLTVAVLAFVLYRIERRPAVLGTLYLALASVLLLTPAQPYTGGLLPVNMAMLATRNLEYILYMAVLVYILRSPRVHVWRFWLAISGLAILIASDKLFLALSAGAASAMLLVYALRQRAAMVHSAARWLLGSLLAAIGATIITSGINISGVTSIVGGSSPYLIVNNGGDLALGVVYGVLGLLTNFGANPAYDATRIHDIASTAIGRLLDFTGPIYVINLLIVLLGCLAAWLLIRPSLRIPHVKDKEPDTATLLSVALIGSSLVALGFFIVTNHYYAVDARYLTVAVFGLFVVAATYTRQRDWRRNRLIITGCIIMAGIFLAVPTVINSYATNRAALSEMNRRDALVAQALKHHKVAALVGDYWRVIPTRQAAQNTINVVPLGDCTHPRDALMSKHWQYDLNKSSFAYLLSLDRSLTDFPHCTTDQIVAAYGHPNANLLIAGTFAEPKEVLLFYDRGSQPIDLNRQLQSVASVAPITPGELPTVDCNGATVMNVVAHQDDDLLFTSPDLLADVQAGHCVRSVYVTAGDAGYDQFYWLNRQQGSEAAYDNMTGTHHAWVQRTLRLANNQFVTVSSPKGDDKILLVFMNLPDGDLHGEGFRATRFESLAKLEAGKIRQVHTVDKQSNYTSTQLVDALALLMETFQPSEIRTQAMSDQGYVYADHSDHMAVGRFATKAYERFSDQSPDRDPPPIFYYIGYPIHELPANVGEPELSKKEAAFFAYARHDGGACTSLEMCNQTSVYGYYLQSQYRE